MRRAAAALLVVVALWGCGDGLAEPSGFDAGPPPLPTGTNFLDERLAGCPTLAELASVADHKMIFDDTTAVGPLLCHSTEGSADLTYARKRVMWALILMKELRFDAPLPWTSKPLYDWYRDTINGVRIIGGEGTSRLGLDRMAIIFVRTSSTEALKWPSLQQFIGLLLHEVRHVDVGAHPCQGQWDNRVSDMGATGVQNLFFTWIGEHAGPAVIPVEYRPYANHTACTHRGSAFCMEPRQDCR